jgi:hypothetical protein
MKIDTTKQLDSLLKTLRKNGVTVCKVSGMEFTISPLPGKRAKAMFEEAFPEAHIQIPVFDEETINKRMAEIQAQTGEVSPPGEIKTPDALTDKQLLDWSVREEPGTDSAN